MTPVITNTSVKLVAVHNICPAHVLHNIDRCYPQHTPTTYPVHMWWVYVVDDIIWCGCMLWVTKEKRSMFSTTYHELWTTTICCGQHSWTCVPQHRQLYPQHTPTTYAGTMCCGQLGICCGLMLWTTTIYCGQHVLHNIGNCYPQHTPTNIKGMIYCGQLGMSCGIHVVDNNYILWATCVPQL